MLEDTLESETWSKPAIKFEISDLIARILPILSAACYWSNSYDWSIMLWATYGDMLTGYRIS